MRKKTVAILGSLALFGVVSLAVANNTRGTQEAEGIATEQALSTADETSAEAELVGGIANGIMDKAIEKGYGTEREKNAVTKSKIIEKTFQAFLDSDYDPAAAVDKAAEVAVEQGWAKSKTDAKRKLRKEIEKARKNENLINKFYAILGI